MIGRDEALRIVAGAEPERPVLIAGPTASGKSALALAIAERLGGVVINADALQVYAPFPVLTAQPDAAERARAPHALYGHLAPAEPWSVGHWIAAVRPLLGGARPIITGGTGLYFSALTGGLAEIPPVPPEVRAEADALPLASLVEGVDAATLQGLDRANRARVQRAWEVLRATGRGLVRWQERPASALLPLSRTLPLLIEAPKGWLTPRIAARARAMLAGGALDEVREALDWWDPRLPAARAIGAAEIVAHLRGDMDLDAVAEAIAVRTRQYAKRQRTWFRARAAGWTTVDALSTERSTD